MEISELNWERITSKKYKLYVPELRLTMFLVKQGEELTEPSWLGVGQFDYKSGSMTYKTELQYSADDAKTKLIGQVLVGLGKAQAELSMVLTKSILD